MITLLLIEDDPDLSAELSVYLSAMDFHVQTAASLGEAESYLGQKFDLVLLDINLPDGSGLDLLSVLRERSATGVVICTGRHERELRISSLRDGADAYLVKPVDPEELEATLRCVNRRLQNGSGGFLLMRPKSIPWRLDIFGSLLMAPNGVSILLQPNEARALCVLFRQKDQSATRDQMIADLDESPDRLSAHRLEVLISRLRKKVVEKSGLRLPIAASYGCGYRFNAPAWYSSS